MEHRLDTGLPHHVVGHALHHFRIQHRAVADDLVLAAGSAVASPLENLVHIVAAPDFLGRLDDAVYLPQPLNDLLHLTLDDQVALAVAQAVQQEHKAAGGHAAQVAVTLHQNRLGAASGRADRSAQTRGAAADNQHVRFGVYRNLLPFFYDKAVHLA